MTNDRLRLTIQEVAYPGRGVARHEGMVHFIEGALPGEEVTVEVFRRHKNFAEAALISVEVASPHRIESGCPLFIPDKPETSCQGCRYQHVSHPEELRIKARQVHSLLKRLACITLDEPPRVIAAPSTSGYRNKLTLHRGPESLLGYLGADNRTVLDVPACPLGNDAINQRLAELRADPAFMADFPEGASVVLRHTPTDGVVVMGDPGTAPTLTESTLAGDITVPATSFFQVNPAVAKLLQAAVHTHIQRMAPRFFLDLYCGVGVFTFVAARAGVPSAHGIDSDSDAIRLAKTHAARMNLVGVSFRQGIVEEVVHTVRPDSANTLVLVDPPRRGLAPAVLAWLIESKIASLLYVSCAPDTLARDIGKLKCAGYAIGDIAIYDMFPRTAHMEILVHLSRGV